MHTGLVMIVFVSLVVPSGPSLDAPVGFCGCEFSPTLFERFDAASLECTLGGSDDFHLIDWPLWYADFQASGQVPEKTSVAGPVI